PSFPLLIQLYEERCYVKHVGVTELSPVAATMRPACFPSLHRYQFASSGLVRGVDDSSPNVQLPLILRDGGTDGKFRFIRSLVILVLRIICSHSLAGSQSAVAHPTLRFSAEPLKVRQARPRPDLPVPH